MKLILSVKPNRAFKGITTIAAEVTLRFASKSVFPWQMDEIIRIITPPTKRPTTEAMTALINNVNPHAPPSKPPPTALMPRKLQMR